MNPFFFVLRNVFRNVTMMQPSFFVVGATGFVG